MAILTFPTSEPNFIESWDIDLVAGNVKILEAYGRAVVAVFAASPFQMSFNNGKYFHMWQGAKWILQENERYNILKLTSAVNQRVTLVTGNFLYDQTSVTTIVQAAKTTCRPGVATLAAGATTTLDTVPTGLTYRKSLIVTNNDTAIDLDVLVRNSSGVYTHAATVFHLQAWFLESSDNIQIKNPGGTTVSLGILETFYISQ